MQKIDPDFNPIEVGKLTVVSESMHSIFNFLNPTDDGSEVEVQLAAIERAEEEFYGNSTTTIDQEDTINNNNNERKSGNVTEYIGQDSLVSEMSMIMSPTDDEFKRGVSTEDDYYWNSDKPSESLQPTDYIMPIFSRPHVYFSFPRDF